ncbi:hypothetical protein FRC98_00890 [Lujinxingia vulgaris]|uniref:DUF5723 domain-containing protein n=1 Tax=Lujinxingia vulgaris TaxID=2600176 RepID=A0A5C6XJ93_9DELT|nr:hypothetical protein [Lujinxingia vulgaris]TXD38990.1 hypothetical protein FRC98_00890 [Lujinxingia vulgaris]
MLWLRHRTLTTLLAGLSLLAFSPRASAQANEDAKSADAAVIMLSAEAGVGPIAEDIFLNLTPRLTFIKPLPAPLCEGGGTCSALFHAGLQVPLRLRLADRAPEQDALLREEDWLELSDYLRIIRRLEYGTLNDPLYVRLGELGGASLGNGTIIGGYYNVITTDHYRLGLRAHLDLKRAGVELLANNLVSPNLLGIRAHLRPTTLIESAPRALDRLQLGATLVTDLRAPTDLQRNPDGTALAGPTREPLVESSQPTTLLGLDARFNLVERARLSITPYLDLNTHLGLGSGLHAGLLWRQNIADPVELSARVEYRRLTDRYLPEYIDPLYEVSRFQTLSPTEPGLAGPKLRVARSTDPATRHGAQAWIQARLAGILTLSAAYEDAQGPGNAALRTRAALQLASRLQLGAFYYKAQLDAPASEGVADGLFELDGALTVAEGRLGLWGPLYAHAQYGGLWQLRDDGVFETVRLWNIGLGAGMSF